MQKGYVRHSKAEIQEVLDLIGVTKSAKINGVIIGVNSIRLQCFKNSGIECASCKIQGEYFALDGMEGEKPHLNLYAIDGEGEEVLMTKDHIHPRSKGGRNHIDNMQTMCQPCNVQKGDSTQMTVQERIEMYEAKGLKVGPLLHDPVIDVD